MKKKIVVKCRLFVLKVWKKVQMDIHSKIQVSDHDHALQLRVRLWFLSVLPQRSSVSGNKYPPPVRGNSHCNT